MAFLLGATAAGAAGSSRGRGGPFSLFRTRRAAASRAVAVLLERPERSGAPVGVRRRGEQPERDGGAPVAADE